MSLQGSTAHPLRIYSSVTSLLVSPSSNHCREHTFTGAAHSSAPLHTKERTRLEEPAYPAHPLVEEGMGAPERHSVPTFPTCPLVTSFPASNSLSSASESEPRLALLHIHCWTPAALLLPLSTTKPPSQSHHSPKPVIFELKIRCSSMFRLQPAQPSTSEVMSRLCSSRQLNQKAAKCRVLSHRGSQTCVRSTELQPAPKRKHITGPNPSQTAHCLLLMVLNPS